MSSAAPLADEMSGTNEKTFPAWIALKVELCGGISKGYAHQDPGAIP